MSIMLIRSEMALKKVLIKISVLEVASSKFLPTIWTETILQKFNSS